MTNDASLNTAPRLQPDARWAPALRGEDANAAMLKVRQIAESLIELPSTSDLGIAGGLPGIALFFAYAGSALEDSRFHEAARRFLDESIDALPERLLSPGLYHGFSSTAWVVQHLSPILYEEQARDLEEVDEALVHALSHSPWTGPFDLLSGLTGIGRYFLDREPGEVATRALGLVVDRLAECSVHKEGGVTWFTAAAHLPDWQREFAPDGYYNVGVAHGVPGAFKVLVEIAAAGIRLPESRRLASESYAWMLSQRSTDPEAGSVFPDWVTASPPAYRARSGWCYGDEGICAVLLSAAHLDEDAGMRSLATDVAIRASRRPSQTGRVRDACLCHGAAGLGHLFSRMYSFSGEEELQRTAGDWFRRALEMSSDRGIAGYQVWNGREWEDDPGFLTGSAGIGLALLSSAVPLEPRWDRLLLL